MGKKDQQKSKQQQKKAETGSTSQTPLDANIVVQKINDQKQKQKKVQIKQNERPITRSFHRRSQVTQPEVLDVKIEDSEDCTVLIFDKPKISTYKKEQVFPQKIKENHISNCNSLQISVNVGMTTLNCLQKIQDQKIPDLNQQFSFQNCHSLSQECQIIQEQSQFSPFKKVRRDLNLSFENSNNLDVNQITKKDDAQDQQGKSESFEFNNQDKRFQHKGFQTPIKPLRQEQRMTLKNISPLALINQNQSLISKSAQKINQFENNKLNLGIKKNENLLSLREQITMFSPNRNFSLPGIRDHNIARSRIYSAHSKGSELSIPKPVKAQINFDGSVVKCLFPIEKIKESPIKQSTLGDAKPKTSQGVKLTSAFQSPVPSNNKQNLKFGGSNPILKLSNQNTVLPYLQDFQLPKDEWKLIPHKIQTDNQPNEEKKQEEKNNIQQNLLDFQPPLDLPQDVFNDSNQKCVNQYQLSGLSKVGTKRKIKETQLNSQVACSNHVLFDESQLFSSCTKTNNVKFSQSDSKIDFESMGVGQQEASCWNNQSGDQKSLQVKRTRVQMEKKKPPSVESQSQNGNKRKSPSLKQLSEYVYKLVVEQGETTFNNVMIKLCEFLSQKFGLSYDIEKLRKEEEGEYEGEKDNVEIHNQIENDENSLSNLKRRVYDVMNVQWAAGIFIKKDKFFKVNSESSRHQYVYKEIFGVTTQEVDEQNQQKQDLLNLQSNLKEKQKRLDILKKQVKQCRLKGNHILRDKDQYLNSLYQEVSKLICFEKLMYRNKRMQKYQRKQGKEIFPANSDDLNKNNYSLSFESKEIQIKPQWPSDNKKARLESSNEIYCQTSSSGQFGLEKKLTGRGGTMKIQDIARDLYETNYEDSISGEPLTQNSAEEDQRYHFPYIICHTKEDPKDVLCELTQQNKNMKMTIQSSSEPNLIGDIDLFYTMPDSSFMAKKDTDLDESNPDDLMSQQVYSSLMPMQLVSIDQLRQLLDFNYSDRTQVEKYFNIFSQSIRQLSPSQRYLLLQNYQ